MLLVIQMSSDGSKLELLFCKNYRGIDILLNWIREKTKSEINAKMIDCDEFYIGLDFALSPETINMLPGQIISDPDIKTHEDSNKMELILDEHELALS